MKGLQQPLPSLQRPVLLISACLCGEACRYDGTARADERFLRLVRSGEALPVCPEVLGGLPVPRPPCEIRLSRVITRDGEDKTREFLLGAEKTLALAKRYGIRTAVLKERSPSCGSSCVHDGSFSGICLPGRGIAAALLIRSGIAVYSEENVPDDFCGLPASEG